MPRGGSKPNDNGKSANDYQQPEKIHDLWAFKWPDLPILDAAGNFAARSCNEDE